MPPSGAYSYEVVDGQQRLRAIWNFVDDNFSLPNDFERVGNTVIAGKSFSGLAPSIKKRILDFPVMVAQISKAGEPEISRLFSRMQMGVRLNPAELRNATQTGLRHAIDALARTHPFFQNSKISAKRFKHQDYLAHLLSICYHKAGRDLKAPQLAADYETITDPNEYSPLIAACDEILEFMAQVNLIASKRLTQKWMLTDLSYFLFCNHSSLGKIDVTTFAKTYQEFDEQRRKYNAEPELLLKGRPKKAERDLYDYIVAFKISGAERKNLQMRSNVVQRRFADLLGG